MTWARKAKLSASAFCWPIIKLDNQSHNNQACRKMAPSAARMRALTSSPNIAAQPFVRRQHAVARHQQGNRIGAHSAANSARGGVQFICQPFIARDMTVRDIAIFARRYVERACRPARGGQTRHAHFASAPTASVRPDRRHSAILLKRIAQAPLRLLNKSPRK